MKHDSPSIISYAMLAVRNSCFCRQDVLECQNLMVEIMEHMKILQSDFILSIVSTKVFLNLLINT